MSDVDDQDGTSGAAPDGDDGAAGEDGTASDRPASAAVGTPAVPSPHWHPTTKIVAAIALSGAALGALYLARHALSLVALSGLIAFLVAPLIRLMTNRLHMPKVAALLVSYFMVLVGILFVGALIVGGVVSSVSEIDPPEVATQLRNTAVDWLDDVRTINIGSYSVDLREAVDPLKKALEENEALAAAEEAAEEAADDDSSTIILGRGQVETLAGGVVSSVRTVGGFVAAALVSVLVTFLVAVYLSADSHKFHAGLRRQVPAGYEGDADRLSRRLGQIWKGYLYGQLVNSLATGLLVWLVLWAVGLPGAFVFGVIMALLNMIPTFGPIIAAVPGVLAAIALGSTRLDWSNLTFALLILGIYVLVVQVQANFMAPFITGKAVQMSPATILIGLIVGFQVGGLVGSLLVVPVLATFKEAGKYLMAKLLDRDPFDDAEPESPPRPDLLRAPTGAPVLDDG